MSFELQVLSCQAQKAFAHHFDGEADKEADEGSLPLLVVSTKRKDREAGEVLIERS